MVMSPINRSESVVMSAFIQIVFVLIALSYSIL